MVSLKLNESVEKFKEFYGRNTDQMPKLIKEGRTPLSVAGLMKRRLEVLTASEEVKNAWWINYFDTGDAVIYHRDRRFKIVLNAELMKDLNPESKLKNGALILPEEVYDKLDGETFTREETERYVEKFLTKKEAKKNPIWKALAGGDQALLDSYVDAVFKRAKESYFFNKAMRNNKIMGIWLSQPEEVILGRLWCVDGVERYDSDAGGDKYLNYSSNLGRLVGVAPEAH